MSGKVKTGRRASTDERAMARWIVDLYRQADANGGSWVVNPEDDREEHTTVHVDAEWLLGWLEDFAENGTFAVLGNFQEIMANAIAAKAGPRFEDRVLAVQEHLNVSERTAARLISRKGK